MLGVVSRGDPAGRPRARRADGSSAGSACCALVAVATQRRRAADWARRRGRRRRSPSGRPPRCSDIALGHGVAAASEVVLGARPWRWRPELLLAARLCLPVDLSRPWGSSAPLPRWPPSSWGCPARSRWAALRRTRDSTCRPPAAVDPAAVLRSTSRSGAWPRSSTFRAHQPDRAPAGRSAWARWPWLVVAAAAGDAGRVRARTSGCTGCGPSSWSARRWQSPLGARVDVAARAGREDIAARHLLSGAVGPGILAMPVYVVWTAHGLPTLGVGGGVGRRRSGRARSGLALARAAVAGGLIVLAAGCARLGPGRRRGVDRRGTRCPRRGRDASCRRRAAGAASAARAALRLVIGAFVCALVVGVMLTRAARLGARR